MPWKECKPMDERLRFVARLLEGEKMTPVCREFGISRVTGYKIFNRYKECGLEALNDRSRRPYRQANRLPFQIERSILGIKREHPSWGAPKIRDKLIKQYPMIKSPAISTVHAVLDRHGLVKRRKRRRYKAQGTELHAAHEPNGLWCADYKGEFMLGNKQYCYPLTITDYRSRYLLACEGVTSTRSDFAFGDLRAGLQGLWPAPGHPHRQRRRPLPRPTPCSGSPGSSVWWLRLGIQIQRIKPGHPQQNGRHERMHLTLKQEATKPASFNFLQQQERFERFVGVYNHERPHQALNGACPGELYTPSARDYRPPADPDYPFHDRTVRVTRCGRICIGRRKINLSNVFAGQLVGVREVDDRIWLVSFLHFDLGFFDHQEGASNPRPIPSPRSRCKPCLR